MLSARLSRWVWFFEAIQPAGGVEKRTAEALTFVRFLSLVRTQTLVGRRGTANGNTRAETFGREDGADNIAGCIPLPNREGGSGHAAGMAIEF